MILFPVRVEDAEVDRLPWVSISIAAICALMFVTTYLVPRDPDGMPDEALESVLSYWQEHPYLALQDRMLGLLHPAFRKKYDSVRAGSARLAPDVESVSREQRTLDDLVTGLFRRADRSLLRRLALVPERGYAQVGLITHMFLHLGWLHLIGNMFYFYLAGLLLEDRWGRGVFAAFYLVGGVVAATAFFMLDRHSPVLMVGASGAIAACMGAFSVRFASRKIRMAYLFWIYVRLFRGTFLVSAWIWGVFWFLGEVFSFLVDNGGSGVAFSAHIAGFGFGAAVAIALKTTGVESRFIAPMVARKTHAYHRPEGLDRADAALARGDQAGARKELEAVLAETPDAMEAEVMLLRMDMGRAERAFSRLAGKSPSLLVQTVEEVAPALDWSVLRPATAFRVASVLEQHGPEGLRPVAEQIFAAAAREPGPFAAKALVRAAQARLEGSHDARGALQYLEQVKAIPAVAPDLQARAAELEQRARADIDREKEVSPRFSRAISLTDEPEPAPEPAAPAEPEPEPAAPEAGAPRSGQVRVTEVQLGGMTRDALSLVLDGGGNERVALANLLAVAVCVAAEPSLPNSPPRNILYTDLVTSWGGPSQPAQVMRLRSSTLRLNNFYPG
ncbi:MAG TPA: rhomboid family intramembrane serine protease, partial [Myxococcales bacterium]|nr:rhomboid family intramembrane serine protease [Myxococcales bacterium]